MKIILQHCVSKIEDSRETVERLYRAFRVRDETFYYRQQKSKYPIKGDGFIPFVGMNGSFKTGLYRRIADAAGCPVEIEDRRQRPFDGIEYGAVFEHELWPEQVAGIDAFVADPYGVASWEFATNAGKTETTFALIDRMGLRATVIVPSRHLLRQTVERAEKCFPNIKVGRLGDSEFDPAPELNVAIINTLHIYSRPGDTAKHRAVKGVLDNTNLLVIDEVDVGAGTRDRNASPERAVNRYQEVLAKCPAYYVLGMSGTVDTGDKLKNYRLEELSGPVIARISNKQLVDKGRSSEGQVVTFRYESGLRKTSFEESDDYAKRAVFCNDTRNAVLSKMVEVAAEEGLRSIVFTQRVLHARHIVGVIANSGLRVGLVSGDVPVWKRQQILKDLESRKLDVVVANLVLDRGVSVASFDVGIDATTPFDKARLKQQVGRTLRKKDHGLHKFFFILFDDASHDGYHRDYKAKIKVLEEEQCFEFAEVRNRDEWRRLIRDYMRRT